MTSENRRLRNSTALKKIGYNLLMGGIAFKMYKRGNA